VRKQLRRGGPVVRVLRAGQARALALEWHAGGRIVLQLLLHGQPQKEHRRCRAISTQQ
jgi:hypothetical protein